MTPIPASMGRWKEFSHAFLLATLLIAIISVTGSVLSLTFLVQREGGIMAQGAPFNEPPPGQGSDAPAPQPFPESTGVPVPTSDPAGITPEPTPEPGVTPPVSRPTLSVKPVSVPVGGTVQVTVTNGPGNPYDWVGQYLEDALEGLKLVDWKYLNDRQDLPPSGYSSALLSFVPSSSGKYHFRLHSYSSKTGDLRTLATSPIVIVTGAASPPAESPSPIAGSIKTPSPVASLPTPSGIQPPPKPIPPAPAAVAISPIAPPVDAQRVSTTAAVVAVAVSIPVTAATALTAAAAVPGGFAGLSSSLFPLFAWVRPRRRPWGRVVEEHTNLPVAGAVVTILDASGRPRESVSSRNDGTFAVLLPRGTYQFTVQHPRFTFASAPQGITLFPEEQLYRGGSLDVKGEEGMAPLPPLVIGMNPPQPRTVHLRERFRSRFELLRVLHAQAAIPIILVGAAINSVALWLNPTPLLVSYEILHGVFLTFELLLSRVARRTLGKVRDAVAKSPVGLAIVRLMDTQTKRLVATRVTTPRGNFLLMPPPGNYRLQVSHAAYAPYTSDPLRIGWGGASAVRLKVDLVPGETQRTRAI